MGNGSHSGLSESSPLSWGPSGSSLVLHRTRCENPLPGGAQQPRPNRLPPDLVPTLLPADGEFHGKAPNKHSWWNDIVWLIQKPKPQFPFCKLKINKSSLKQTVCSMREGCLSGLPRGCHHCTWNIVGAQ